MGVDTLNSVVDSKLRVHGITALRVVDASVFPTQVSGHPCAVVVAIAEKIGDRRLQSYNLGNLGRVAYNQKDPQAALQYLKQALTMTQQLGEW